MGGRFVFHLYSVRHTSVSCFVLFCLFTCTSGQENSSVEVLTTNTQPSCHILSMRYGLAEVVELIEVIEIIIEIIVDGLVIIEVVAKCHRCF